MRKEAVIIGGLALIGAYLYFSQGKESNNQFLTGGGYIPKKMIPPVEPTPVEPTSSNITYNIQFPELNIPQYTPSFTSEPSPETLTKKSKTRESKTSDIPVSPPPTGSSTMQNVLRAAEEKGAYKPSTGMKKELERAALAAGALHTVDYSQYGFSPASSLYAEGGISSPTGMKKELEKAALAAGVYGGLLTV